MCMCAGAFILHPFAFPCYSASFSPSLTSHHLHTNPYLQGDNRCVICRRRWSTSSLKLSSRVLRRLVSFYLPSWEITHILLWRVASESRATFLMPSAGIAQLTTLVSVPALCALSGRTIGRHTGRGERSLLWLSFSMESHGLILLPPTSQCGYFLSTKSII